jgi:DNA-binding CsgD family transcriptional regulator
VGDPIAVRAAAEEGRVLADANGDRFASHGCRWSLGVAQGMTGDAAGAVAQLGEVIAETHAAHDVYWGCCALFMQALLLAYHGDPSAARESANSAVEAAAELGGFFPGLAYAGLTIATLAAGDVAAADDAIAAGLPHLSLQPKQAAIWVAYAAQAALASGNLTAARCLADDAVAATSGFHLALALATRAGVGIAQGQPEQAGRDAHDALATVASSGAYAAAPETLECLAALAVGAGGGREAARLFGAADGIRQRGCLVRFKIFDAFFEFPVAALRNALGERDFVAAWAEGVALSTEEAIAYAQRGHGKRKRPNSGWAALTPTERDVVRLVSEGLANNDIATRLFVSPRTVQTHLTHVYTKLGLSSRVQLAQEAARRG